MRHKQCESWKSSEETLISQSENSLVQLQTSDPCYQIDQQWRQIERLLTAAPMMVPASGFVDRWNERLAIQQKRQERRRSLIFAFISGAGGISLILVWAILLPNVQGIRHFLIQGLARSVDWFVFFEVARDILVDLFRTLPSAIPLPLWMFIFGLIEIGGLVWLISLRKLAEFPKVSSWAYRN